jgi:hypothetical protein
MEDEEKEVKSITLTPMYYTRSLYFVDDKPDHYGRVSKRLTRCNTKEGVIHDHHEEISKGEALVVQLVTNGIHSYTRFDPTGKIYVDTYKQFITMPRIIVEALACVRTEIHEVILTTSINLFFDLDMKETTAEEGQAQLARMVCVLVDELLIRPSDILVFCNTRPGKASYHVLCPGYKVDRVVNKAIAILLSETHGIKGIDLQPYNKEHSFRMPWTIKQEKGVGYQMLPIDIVYNGSPVKFAGHLRYSSVKFNSVTAEQREECMLGMCSFVSWLSFCDNIDVHWNPYKITQARIAIDELRSKPDYESTRVENEISDKAYAELLTCIPEGLKEGKRLPEGVNLIKVADWICPACNDRHTKNNAKLILNTKGEILLYCYSTNKFKCVKTTHFTDMGMTMRESVVTIESPIYDQRVNTRYLSEAINLKREFALHPVIAIDSIHGTGKTWMIRQYLEECPEMTVLVVCPKRTLCAEYVASLNKRGLPYQFCSYEQFEKGMIECEHLVIELESLYRVKLPKYDLLILDEITSLSVSLTGPTVTGRDSTMFANHKTFERLIRNSGNVTFMDGQLDKRLDVYRRMRPIYVINNEFRYTGRRVIQTKSHAAQLRFVIDCISEGKKVVCVCMSKTQKNADILAVKDWQVKNGDTRIVLDYDGDTPDEVKRTFADIAPIWGRKDVAAVFYTQTVEVGISYDPSPVELKKNDWSLFDTCAVFANNLTSTPASLVQMTMRARQLKSNTIYFFCNGGNGHAITTPMKVSSKAHEKLLDIRKKYALTQFSKDEFKDMPIYIRELFVLNMEEQRRSVIAFQKEYIARMKRIGYSYVVPEDDLFIEPPEKEVAKDVYVPYFPFVKVLSHEAANDLRYEKTMRKLSIDEKAELVKYELLLCYSRGLAKLDMATLDTLFTGLVTGRVQEKKRIMMMAAEHALVKKHAEIEHSTYAELDKRSIDYTFKDEMAAMGLGVYDQWSVTDAEFMEKVTKREGFTDLVNIMVDVHGIETKSVDTSKKLYKNVWMIMEHVFGVTLKNNSVQKQIKGKRSRYGVYHPDATMFEPSNFDCVPQF